MLLEKRARSRIRSSGVLLAAGILAASCVGDDGGDEDGRDREDVEAASQALVECRSGELVSTYEPSTDETVPGSVTFSPPAKVTIPATMEGTNLHPGADYVLAMTLVDGVSVIQCSYACAGSNCSTVATLDSCVDGNDDPVAQGANDDLDVIAMHLVAFSDSVPTTEPIMTVAHPYEELEPCPVSCDGLSDENDCTIDRCVDDGFGGLVADHTDTCAVPVEPGIATTIGESLDVLIDEGLIHDTDLGSVDLLHAAGVFGKVVYPIGAPASGVEVSVVGHPEYGWTQTDGNGEYVLLVEGGGPLTLDIREPDYLAVHRVVTPRWQGWAHADDVTLTSYDTEATNVPLGTGLTAMATARGSTTEDADGARTATLLVPAGTSADMIVDGEPEELTEMTVRLTEYTVGPSGPSRMPAPLPESSAFTYALEVSVDEAEAAGATGVVFDTPVIFYVENFLGFAVGDIVPVGRYDREQLAWIPEDNGVVVEIISETGTPLRANVDTTGDGVVNGSDLTLSDDEREQLATLYTTGTTLWRVSLDHFSPWDLNWPYYPPDGCAVASCDALPPIPPGPEPPDCTDEETGSILECQTQVLGERIPLPGTGMSLNYRSDRVPGHPASRHLRVPFTGPHVDATLARSEIEMVVAGRVIRDQLVCPPGGCDTDEENEWGTLTWDGLDRFGRRPQGRQQAVVTTSLVYPVVYGRGSSNYLRAFAFASSTAAAGANLFGERRVKRTTTQYIGGWDARSFGLGGWTLDGVHAYDPGSRTLFQGDGTERTITGAGPTIRTVPGTKQNSMTFEGVASLPDGTIYYATNDGYGHVYELSPAGVGTEIARCPSLPASPPPPTTGLTCDTPGSTMDVATGPDGSLYLLQPGRLHRLPAGSSVWEPVAGTGPAAASGDHDPAISATFRSAIDVAVAADGAIYIAANRSGDGTSSTRAVRKISPDGYIETVYQISGTDFVKGIDVAPDGSLVMALGNLNTCGRVERLRTDGALEAVAGSSSSCLPSYQGLPVAEGVPAISTKFKELDELTVGRDGAIYFVSWKELAWGGTERRTAVRVIRDGVISSLAGRDDPFTTTSGTTPFVGEGGPAAAAQLSDHLRAIAVTQSGSVLIGGQVSPSEGLLIVEPAYPGLGLTDTYIPSKDARTVDVFDLQGRHVQTRDAETNLVLKEIEYDSDGRVEKVIDWDGVTVSGGRITEITRAGDEVTITGPDGHATVLTLDANGWLESVQPPDATTQAYAMTYESGASGLLASFQEPESTEASTFEYDELGRLIVDTDPMDEETTLTRTETATGWQVAFARASGLTTTREVERLGNGEEHRSVTRPGLTIAEAHRTPVELHTSVLADGTSVTRKLAPDPRWGMLAPYVASETSFLPSSDAPYTGPTRLVVRQRTVTGMTSPLSFTSLEEKTWVNPTLSGGLPTGGSLATTRTYVQGTRTETISTPLSNVTTRVLDTSGRTSTLTPPDASVLTFTYDSRARMLTSSQGSGGATRTTTRAYRTGDGMLDTLTNAESQVTTFDWDAAGRMIGIVRPDTKEIAFGYDTNGNLDLLTPPDQSAHAFGQDDLDQVTLYDPPDPTTGSWSTTYLFDADRRLDSETRPGSLTIDYGYDSTKGLLSGKTFTTTEKIELGYDSAGRVTAQSGPAWVNSTTPIQGLAFTYFGAKPKRETSVGVANGYVEWAYNTRFLPSSEVVSDGTNSPSISFTYDNDGNLLTAGDLTVVRGAGGRISTLTNQLGSSPIKKIIEARSYDSFGQLSQILVTRDVGGTVSNVYRETITARDKIGRITEREEQFGTGSIDEYEYEYDTVGRLVRVFLNSSEIEEYQYDANGNRTSAQYNGGTPISASAADSQDRIDSYGDADITYLPNGEVDTITRPSETQVLTYDVFGNLTFLDSTVSGEQAYEHDPKGRRVKFTIDDGATFGGAWLWRSELQPVAQLTSGGVIEQRYLYADGVNVPELVVAGTDRWRLIKDHLGSVRMVVDTATGNILRQMTFDAFGRITSSSGTMAQVPFGFAGGFYQPETPFVRFGARDYDPELGRWTSKDPIRFRGGDANIYAYVGNDPVNRLDPAGLGWFDDVVDWFKDKFSSPEPEPEPDWKKRPRHPYTERPEDEFPDFGPCAETFGSWKVRCCASLCNVELDYGDGMDDVCPNAPSERDNECFLKCLGFTK